MKSACDNCGEQKQDQLAWILRNYFGISGYFCIDCYDLVAHDAYNNPKDPDTFNFILCKQILEKNYEH